MTKDQNGVNNYRRKTIENKSLKSQIGDWKKNSRYSKKGDNKEVSEITKSGRENKARIKEIKKRKEKVTNVERNAIERNERR